MSSSTRAESASAANFYSPQNVAFYASEPYAPLDKGTKEIRLVTILPASDDDFLRCELLPAQPLAVIKHQYHALSYCAGDPKQTTPIVIDGLQFNAFVSLGSALHQLRRAAGAEQQLLWVDQICINQRNPMEKAHQVGFMRDIYKNAERVIVWLGDQRYGDLSLQWLQAQADDIKTGLYAVGLAW
ncbi:hypothetical protein E8E11_006329 [Didymella keratinophila]|nr:hypothetical protein E8E11_006329 [Didymella keratinophila]